VSTSGDAIRAAVLGVLSPDSLYFKAVTDWLAADLISTCHQAERSAQPRWLSRLDPAKVAAVFAIITETGWSNCGHEPGTSDSVVEAIRNVVIELLGTSSPHQSEIIDFLKEEHCTFYWDAHLVAQGSWLAQLNARRVARALVEVTEPDRRYADVLSSELDQEQREAR
jgi:hypothetical protein